MARTVVTFGMTIYMSALVGCAANTTGDPSLFVEDFSGNELDLVHKWHFEGNGTARTDNGRVALQDSGVGVVLWTRQDFPPDIQLQFDVSFSNNQGIGVFFIAAKGVNGEDIITDLPTRDGDYPQYTKGNINCYGFSIHRYFPDGRNNPGANIRKNSGFHLVNQAEPDPMLNANQTYQVTLEKSDGLLRLWVDGNLVHDWKDDGAHGPVLQGGKVGFRIRGDRSCVMYVDNIVINTA